MVTKPKEVNMPSIRQCITEYAWEDIITTAFVLIDDAYPNLPTEVKPTRKRGREPVFSDSEVMTVTYLCEYLFDGDEKRTISFLNNYHRDLFPHLLERTRFNRRRRALKAAFEALRQFFTALQGLATDPHRVVDSLPITQCGWRRRHRCVLMRGPLWQGYVAAKKQHFFGLRLHFTTTVLGLVDRWLIAPASLDERDVMPHLVTDDAPRVFLADSGYVRAALDAALFQDCGHRLLALRRRNQRIQWPDTLRRLVTTLRHWIETAGSVLDSVFNIEYPNAKTPSGLLTRITSKLFAYNFSFVLVAVLDATFVY
jgi:hypothetical protein